MYRTVILGFTFLLAVHTYALTPAPKVGEGVIVTFKPSTTNRVRNLVHQKLQTRIHYRFKYLPHDWVIQNTHSDKNPPLTQAQALCAQYKKFPFVSYCAPNYVSSLRTDRAINHTPTERPPLAPDLNRLIDASERIS